jgi:hypothetical protein
MRRQLELPDEALSADQRRSGGRLGGLSSVASGLLFAAQAVLDRIVGGPPPSGAAVLAWRDAHRTALAWSDELTVFWAVLLLPVALALARRLDGPRRPWVGFGCAILASTAPLVLVLGVFEGRLVYPVYGIELDDAAGAALVVSLYFGGAHLVALLFAAAFTMVGVAVIGHRLSPWPTVLSCAAALAQVAAAYPSVIGPDLLLVCHLLAAAWFVAVGLLLLCAPAQRRFRRDPVAGEGTADSSGGGAG